MSISFDREGSLSEIKTLIKQHFSAQGHELVTENEMDFTFQKGTVCNRWFS